MANKTDTSTIFRIVAAVTAVSLLAAAALAYFQDGGGSGQAAELAALSQSIPSQATRAMAGEEGGVDKLDANLKRLAQLRRSAGTSVSGSSSQWQQLESRAAALVAKRNDVEALIDAGGIIESSTAAMLELSNELLDRSGSTAIIQDFQQRVARIGRAAPGLATNPNAATVATGIASDAVFLRTVADALAGESTELDVRALNDDGKEVILVPLAAHLTELETQVERVNGSVAEVDTLATIHAELAASAAVLSNAFSGSKSGTF